MSTNVPRQTDLFHPLPSPPPRRRRVLRGAKCCLTYSRECRLTCSRQQWNPQPSKLVSALSIASITTLITPSTLTRLSGSDQARFRFAKDAIEARRKAGISRGTGAEETVVLAFGGGNGPVGGSAVHVTRKLRKKPLWKINA